MCYEGEAHFWRTFTIWMEYLDVSTRATVFEQKGYIFV